jgi:hypothetical protein
MILFASDIRFDVLNTVDEQTDLVQQEAKEAINLLRVLRPYGIWQQLMLVLSSLLLMTRPALPPALVGMGYAVSNHDIKINIHLLGIF